jgi:hypothetical protein
MRCGFCNREFDPAKWNQRFCKPKCKDDFHNREKLEARRGAEHETYAAQVRDAEDRLLGRVTLDLFPVHEPPLVVKRRKILTVEAGR